MTYSLNGHMFLNLRHNVIGAVRYGTRYEGTGTENKVDTQFRKTQGSKSGYASFSPPGSRVRNRDVEPDPIAPKS